MSFMCRGIIFFCSLSNCNNWRKKTFGYFCGSREKFNILTLQHRNSIYSVRNNFLCLDFYEVIYKSRSSRAL